MEWQETSFDLFHITEQSLSGGKVFVEIELLSSICMVKVTNSSDHILQYSIGWWRDTGKIDFEKPATCFPGKLVELKIQTVRRLHFRWKFI